ncbi:MAG: hypothetical protein ABI559_12735 [Chloroflexota bacterium]
MVRAAKEQVDWVEEYRKNYRERTEVEMANFREVLARADEIRKRNNIAPLTTGELIRSIRDEQESAN